MTETQNDNLSGGKAWFIYILLRLAFFIVPFALLVWLGTVTWLPVWLAAIFAAIIGLALSMLLLSRSRNRASTSIYDWRNRSRTADDIEEDDVIENQSN